MLIFHNENIDSKFEGTIIDIETIGGFCREHGDDDSRTYSKLVPTIFGYITKDELNIICAKGKTGLENLEKKVIEILPALKRPIYAFQSRFERGVLHHCYNYSLKVDGELNADRYEWKGNACSELNIPNYDDPFNNIGKKCIFSWLRGDYENSLKHNRSCLLKERDILLKRNYRKPDNLTIF